MVPHYMVDVYHIAPRCTALENIQKVIKKLKRLVRGAPQSTKENPKSTSEEQCIARVHKVGVPTDYNSLPGGLVGPSMILPIKVNDPSCNALMDSRSNVTIII